MGYVSSFMSEHTAEYVLVPDLAHQLSSIYSSVVPFYYWRTREGANFGVHGDVNARFVAVYARRPKVRRPGDVSITVKFNRQLFSHAEQLHHHGIPTLAGVPCISTLPDHQLGASCAWFALDRYFDYPDDFETQVHVGTCSLLHQFPSDAPVVGPLTTAEIQAFTTNAWVKPWGAGLDAIRESSRRSRFEGWIPSPWWAGSGTYKPFYLAVVD